MLNVASGNPVKIIDIIEKVVTVIGAGTPHIGDLPYRNNENMELFADISKASNTLNFKPRISLNNGLKKTIDWYGCRLNKY
jgi:nucleoside-diphosphate-sugar epimerase